VLRCGSWPSFFCGKEVASSRKLQTAGGKLRTENRALIAENRKLRTAGDKLRTENRALIAENRKLRTAGDKLRTENRALIAENRKLRTENHFQPGNLAIPFKFGRAVPAAAVSPPKDCEESP
jgi:cell division protein FtsB